MGRSNFLRLLWRNATGMDMEGATCYGDKQTEALMGQSRKARDIRDD